MRSYWIIPLAILSGFVMACTGKLNDGEDFDASLDRPDSNLDRPDSNLDRSDSDLENPDSGRLNPDADEFQSDTWPESDLEDIDDGDISSPDADDFEPDADETVCVPLTCSDYESPCGALGNGCNGTIDCGTCSSGTCVDGQCVATNIDCSAISDHPDFRVCQSGPDYCAGVFTNYNGCNAFCAAGGLTCEAAYGGEEDPHNPEGCLPREDHNPLLCGGPGDHRSDWCECGGEVVIIVDPDCEVNPANPPRSFELYFTEGVYEPRSSWVLECYDWYAYTAQHTDHEDCDSLYRAGSGRGTATFVFNDVPKGNYEVWVSGRHTTNRSDDGALFIVTNGVNTYRETINQCEQTDYEPTRVVHGQYCLEGTVQIVLDSLDEGRSWPTSDSVTAVGLIPR